MPFNEAKIRSLASAESFRRGVDYFNSGAVVDLEQRDVIELHRFARETWLAHEPRWLAQRTAHNSIPEPVLRPLNDVLATELLLMRRIRVFDEPPRRLADALKRMRTSDADQSPPDT